MYRPLHKYLTISESRIDGIGLFASLDIPADTELGIGHVRDERFEDGWIRTPLGGFINHSESPNCAIQEKEDFLILLTASDIKAGEELTIYYTLYIPIRV
jgi:SET domain-containing protein